LNGRASGSSVRGSNSTIRKRRAKSSDTVRPLPVRITKADACLAAMQASGRPAWAALSTSGLRALDLPNDVRDVIVLADGDDADGAAARAAALRWKSEGRRVRIAHPPKGMDFNDVLLGRAPSIEGEMQ
jgi:hypothetical protein